MISVAKTSDQKIEKNSKSGMLFGLLMVSICLHHLTAQADELNYIYDQKDQLVGVINEQGQTAIYEYDTLGNLLSIQRQDATDPVTITLVNPNIGAVGTSVEIFGVGFSSISTENQIEFNGIPALTLLGGSNSITTQVPNGSSSGPITVTTALGSAVSPQAFVIPSMAISPSDTTVIARKSLSFSATLTDLNDQRVIWKVNDIIGGNVTLGTITQDGLYTAPAIATEVTVQATSTAYPGLMAETPVTIVKDPSLPDCTIVWDGESGDGLWQTPANWDTNILPSPADDVCIGAGSTVTLSAGEHNINSLTSDGAFIIISSGSLSNAAESTFFNNLTFNVSSTRMLSGTGDINIYGLFTWKGGSMLGTGKTTAHGGINMIGDSAADRHFLGDGRQLDLPAGQTAIWSGGQIYFKGEATFNNRGTFLGQPTGGLTFLNGGGTGAKTFNNAGSFIKDTGTGYIRFTSSIVFNNTGEGGVQVLAGTLQFWQQGTGQYLIGGADFMVETGATLEFNPSSSWGSTVDITGTGTVFFSSGTHTIDGTYNIHGATGQTQFFVSNVTFTPGSNLVSISGNGLLDVSHSTIDFSSGETTLENLTSYTQPGGTVTGSDNITVSGLLTWTGDSMLGTGIITANGGMDISGNSHTLGQQLDLPVGQTAVWTGGNINVNGGATFNNWGTFLGQTTGSLTLIRGSGIFNNAGSFIKDTGVGSIRLNGIVFNNTGEGGVQVLAGALQFWQRGTGQYLIGGADFMVETGATLEFSASSSWGSTVDITGTGTVFFSQGTYTIDGTYNIHSATGQTQFFLSNVTFTPDSNLISITGTGELDVSSSTIDFSSGETTLENLSSYTQSGGMVTGSDNITVSGIMTFTGGSMLGTGITIANGGIDLSQLTQTWHLGRQLDLPEGQTAIWASGNLDFLGGATFNNRGTFRVQHTSGANFIYGGDSADTRGKFFINEGDFIKEIGTGTITISSLIEFIKTGDGGVQVLSGTVRYRGEDL